MKKKILAVALGLTLCFELTGCTKGDIEPKNSYLANKYIDLVTIYKDDEYETEVVYDKNTKVMYFLKSSGYQFGITPIYNSDGTVKLYDGE
jgi:hypothetical protein